MRIITISHIYLITTISVVLFVSVYCGEMSIKPVNQCIFKEKLVLHDESKQRSKCFCEKLCSKENCFTFEYIAPTQSCKLYSLKSNESVLVSSDVNCGQKLMNLYANVKSYEEHQCPLSYTLTSSASPKSKYRYYKDKTYTWKEGRKKCESEGAMLVQIDSEEENQFVNRIIDARIFIGLFLQNGQFFWSGPFSNRLLGNDYENWNPGEPNNSHGREPYVVFLVKMGKWNDIYPESRNRIFCECPGL